jgi:hypothetical protein
LKQEGRFCGIKYFLFYIFKSGENGETKISKIKRRLKKEAESPLENTTVGNRGSRRYVELFYIINPAFAGIQILVWDSSTVGKFTFWFIIKKSYLQNIAVYLKYVEWIIRLKKNYFIFTQ